VIDRASLHPPPLTPIMAIGRSDASSDLLEGFDLMTAPGPTLGGDTVKRAFSTAMSARDKSGMIELEERDVSAA
jgi:hypothetical protein